MSGLLVGIMVTQMPYRLSPNTVCRDRGGVFLLLNPDTPSWIVVNEAGKDVLDLLDGQRTARQIAEVLAKRYEVSEEVIEEDVVKFLSEAFRRRFLEQAPQGIGKEESRTLVPEHMDLSVTNACNLSCPHCYSDSGAPFPNELNMTEIRKLLKSFVELGGRGLALSGGEPLMRPDLSHILEYASATGLKKIILVTNGSLFNDELVRCISRARICEVQVSIDGADAGVNDSIRGAGHFEAATRAAEKLVRHHVRTTIALTVMRPTLGQIDGFLRLSKKIGAEGVHFTLLKNFGRAERNTESLEPSPVEICDARSKIRYLSKKMSVIVDFEKGLHEYLNNPRRAETCDAGIRMLSINSTGEAYPCVTLNGQEFFRAGSIRTSDLDSIWNDSPVFAMLRSRSVLDIPGCSECEFRLICAGGCLAETYKTYGTLMKRSPRCDAMKLKDAYWEALIDLAFGFS